MATSRTFTINLMGDVMLGRLIDQLFPTHVDCPEEAQIISTSRSRDNDLKYYRAESPWGNALSLIRSGDLNIINLETSITTHEIKWPHKVFNYRMHPANVESLMAAHIDHVSLANNHTLDFDETGLLDTVNTVRDANIKFAGAGETSEEAARPAQLSLPRDPFATNNSSSFPITYHILAYSFSDHPQDWSAVPQFNFIDYKESTRRRLKEELNDTDQEPALKIVSVHWGPNYCWSPSAEIRALAHFFVDECGVDLIHGHSSHHIQGVEVYKGKLIIYGCGDFVDDYAVVPGEWRNDLGALWRVTVAGEGEKLVINLLEVFPHRMKNFRAGLLDRADQDHKWLAKRLRELCAEIGTNVQDELGADGQIMIEVS